MEVQDHEWFKVRIGDTLLELEMVVHRILVHRKLVIHDHQLPDVTWHIDEEDADSMPLQSAHKYWGLATASLSIPKFFQSSLISWVTTSVYSTYPIPLGCFLSVSVPKFLSKYFIWWYVIHWFPRSNFLNISWIFYIKFRCMCG